MTPNWNTTLDAFESHLLDQSALVEGGRYDEVAVFTPPADLPALPRALVSRASELLGRAQALTERAAAIRDETSRRLAQSRHPVFAQLSVPAYLDQKA